MRQMFESATIKLTAWYLLILMFISILFSFAIYQLATSELSARIDSIQSRIEASPTLDIPNDFFGKMQLAQKQEAKQSIAAGLFYLNIFIFMAGGFGSFFLARRMLIPIEEVHEAQSRFVSDASHELRTPLAVMKVELETSLRDPRISKKEMYELLKSNLEEVDKLTNLSHTLLQLSRLDSSDIKMETLDLNSLTSGIAKRYDPENKRILIKNGKQLTVLANKSSLEELITILIDNALKYSPEDTIIDVQLKKKGRNAQFTISNEGEGIKTEDLPHIFNRFYRADSSRTHQKNAHGYGLGLSLAKKIVEIHNGELTVSSAPNHITTFTVLIPLTRMTKQYSQHA